MRGKITKLILVFGGVLGILINYSCCNKDNVDAPVDYSQYVNTFIGTSGTGHTFPGATVPFGMVQLSPNTGNYDWPHHSGYQYNDSTVKGFAHTHLSGGANPVLGDVLVLPFTKGEARHSMSVPFSKQEEKASPGYYSTQLSDDNIKVELSATLRTGIQRYTFEDGGESHIFINLNEVLQRKHPEKSAVSEAFFKIESDTVIYGYQRSYVKQVDRKVYFAMSLSRPYSNKHFIDGDTKRSLVLDYNLKPNDQIVVRVGISSVDIASAKKNLYAESMGKSFDEIHQEAVDTWNSYLSKIKIEGTKEQKVQLYTSLYHMFIQPNNIADVDGKYYGADDSIHTAPSNHMYSTFAFWDVYRTGFPLYTILVPEKITPFVNSIIAHYDQKGHLPAWALWGRDTKVMIGNHATSILVDAYLKGLYTDGERAFEAIKATLTITHWNKHKWHLYDGYGYVPSDAVISESVSRTMEASYDDFCAAQLAEKLNKQEDYDFFIKRSGYYKNLFDPSFKLMRGKNKNGSWVEPFETMKISHAGTSNGDYTEANAWHYTWHVQHDIKGLIELMGSKEIFANMLDSMLSMDPVIIGDGNTKDVSGMIGQYAHGNEPCQHIPYLYNYVGQPHKTQELVTEILKTQYNTSPEGYCGNNDFGQMSAWFVASSLGFYPVNPVSGMFDIGIPSYPYAAIKLESGLFEIKTKNFSAENKHVRSVTLNGKPVSNYKISYADIMKGGELVFEMEK